MSFAPTAEASSVLNGDAEKLGQFLDGAQYKEAKSYRSWCPHEYTLLKTWGSREDFHWCAESINRLGRYEFFMGRPRMYFYHGEHRYWIMDKDPRDAVLINREIAANRDPKPIPTKFR